MRMGINNIGRYIRLTHAQSLVLDDEVQQILRLLDGKYFPGVLRGRHPHPPALELLSVVLSRGCSLVGCLGRPRRSVSCRFVLRRNLRRRRCRRIRHRRIGGIEKRGGVPPAETTASHRRSRRSTTGNRRSHIRETDDREGRSFDSSSGAG